MIVRQTIPLKWFLKIDGWNVLFFALYAYAVCILHLEFFFEQLAFPFTGISVFGTAVAILLGFRNNSAYERFWEARTAWGQLTNASRNFASQVMTYIHPMEGTDAKNEKIKKVHEELIYRHLAYVNALRLQLREDESWDGVSSFLLHEDWKQLKSLSNKAVQLNHRQSQRLGELAKAGWIEPQAHVRGLMESIKTFYEAQGTCERIKNTPLPRQYGFFTKAFVWVFVLLLPFSLVQHLGWGTLPVYVALATIFTIIDRMGHRTEDPFDGKYEDVPMNAICRSIEIDLRQQLGESSVPPRIEPQDGVLM